LAVNEKLNLGSFTSYLILVVVASNVSLD
jgi:hypothetical protein